MNLYRSSFLRGQVLVPLKKDDLDKFITCPLKKDDLDKFIK